MGNGVCSKINALPISDALKVALVSVVGTIQAYWGSNLFYYLIWRFKFFQHFKIQGNKMPAEGLIRKEFWENFVGLWTTIPGAAWAFAQLFLLGDKEQRSTLPGGEPLPATAPMNPTKKPEPPVERKGWVNLRTRGPLPNFFHHFVQIGLAYLMYDAMFYWAHRTLHQPDLYKAIHVTHHKFKTPIGLASSYTQIYETIAQLIMWWVPLGLSGYICGDLHLSTVYWYTIFRWVETVEAHSGYELPFHPLRLLWLPSGARFHDFHHSHFDGNYGATKIWDWLMGTNKDYFEHLKRKQLA